ncbi:hypothetical protein HUN01_06870 [Nostoc edaphicum CCNP1411]|uniref:Uncharacterized protein n=1 Tax=Nostoc edaphicum CCNP1411 TaxID=1472755 RepID=A0A7D7L9S8_9NOSO|nr:hypothetical protein [Nostoc edaphicum]QMS87318.1 hypothetical protein HUN01_06870 [Nostoc edaphicum CCNP1411]
MKVTLKTATGNLVHESEILSQNKYPEVIVWGQRVFTIFAPGVYWEVVCCYVLPSAIAHHPYPELEG